MWKQIPFFVVETSESKSEEMQLLYGAGPISKKIKDMITSSTEDFKVYGTVSAVHRMYYSDIFDWVKESFAEFKLLISPMNNTPDFLSEMESSNIKTVQTNSENKCFIINDNKEVLIFMRNANHPTRQMFARWSDSETLVDMMHTLFDLSWEKGDPVY